MDLKAEAETHQQAIDADRAIAKWKSEAATWKLKYQQAIQRIEQQDALGDLFDSLDQRIASSSWERDKRKTAKGKATAIVVMSDWHVGESVRREAVNGKNEFNPVIAEKRIRKLFQKIPEYVERYVPMAKVVVLAALGDFITGYIHPELAESNSMSPMEECLFFQEHFNAGLSFLLKEMPQTFVIPTANGNHGRTTEKMRHGTSHLNSFEWGTYHFMARQWRHEPRIRWKISDAYHNWLPLHGREVRFHHGEAIRYQGGIGGLTIPAVKAIRGWNTAQHADLDVFGHHHSLFEGHSFICNGSLIGYGSYSLAVKCEFQEPMQAFVVVDERKWLRQVTRIYLDD